MYIYEKTKVSCRSHLSECVVSDLSMSGNAQTNSEVRAEELEWR